MADKEVPLDTETPRISSISLIDDNDVSSEMEKRQRIKRTTVFKGDKDVSNLCFNNGISEAMFTNKPFLITALEMCHFNFPHIVGLQSFPNLRSLCLVAQDIADMRPLEECINLEKLWVCETKVVVISGLDKCHGLKELYLYSNKIRKIQGLDNLDKLERLWLSDNDIYRMQNLNSLKMLKDLQLGNNKIQSIGDSLNDNISLESLNIAGNRLSSFRDILFLASLPNLVSLCLSDPNFADNPLCSLCNYQTHVIYHLPNLKSLDTLDVTEESRKIISATVLKKRMYYNMRIRTIKRNTNFLLKMLQTRSREDERRVEQDTVKLLERSKKIQRRRDDLGLPPGEDQKTEQFSSTTEKLEEARIKLNILVDSKLRTLLRLQNHKKDITHQIAQQSDMAIRKLLLELETGGNVRFEDDQKDDNWFETCESLVKSMILRATAKHNHKRIQIHRISRVHNRYLRNKFDSKLRGAEETRQFEYLCFQSTADKSDETFHAVEHGFSDHLEAERKPLALTNYLEIVGKPESAKGEKGEPKQLHQAVIVKVFANMVRQAHVPKGRAVSQADYPGYHCVYTDLIDSTSSDPCRKYHIFDSDLALPEFFVEYSVKSDLDKLTTKDEKLMVDIAFSNKLSQADMPTLMTQLTKRMVEIVDIRHPLDEVSLQHIESANSEIHITDTLNIAPADLALELVLRKGPAVVQTLNLSLSPLTISVGQLEQFENLKTLNLSHCGLKELPPLNKFTMLEHFDVSLNTISTIVPKLLRMPRLQYLNLCKNQIISFENIRCMRDNLPTLSSLDMRFNPIARRKGCRQMITSSIALETLALVDGIAVVPTEKVLPARFHGQILENSDTSMENATPEALAARKANIEFFYHHSSTQPHLFRPLSVRTQSGYGSSATQNEFWTTAHPLADDGVPTLQVTNITTLELDNCNLFDLDLLPLGLIHLRWASFRNNNLRDVSRLSFYPRLEELSLEHNEIENIDALSQLLSLTKLDASNNRISTVDTAKNFRNLMLLSLENNRIKSLKPFSKMATLMEFYIANNYISELYGIFPLKDLPRLIILDLTGNGICQIANYRLFSIFHLSKLKILDGASITPKEQSAAKEAYLGKLTIELLGEKIGHFSFRNITELDLHGSKIREIDCFNVTDFRNIKKLNFDNNLITNLDSFLCLTNLRSLSLNANKIEKLLSTDGPAVMGPHGWKLEGYDNFRVKPIFPHLEELHLGSNNISRIADLGLYRIPQLKNLYLAGNRISRMEGFENMTNLVELVLDKNHIKGAEPSSFLPLINLKELHLKENRLKSLSYFDCLPNLQYLMLQNNRLAELVELEKMKLPNIIEINMIGNAILRKQLYRTSMIIRFPHIICIDTREVTDDERQKAEMSYADQCMVREEMSPSLKMPMSIQPAPMLSASANSLSKLPIKITSVVLDGLEMKLSANSGFGSQKQL